MILFYILILSLPMVDHPQFGYLIHGITVEKLLGVACFFFALCYLPNRKSFPQLLATGQARVFFAFTIMAVTSYVFMVTPFDWHEMVGIIFTELVFFIATSIFIDSRQRLENSVLMLVASIGLASLYLIKEWASAVSTYGLLYRPGSVAGDPNVFSASATTVLPIMAAFAFGRSGWKRAFCVVCLLLTLVAILLASSRGAFIALVVLLLLQMRDARHRGKFFVVALVILALFLVSPVSPLDRLLHPTGSDTDSSEARLQLWSIAFRIFADHPILGVGLWQFAPYMRAYMPSGVDLQFHVPHNTYLEIGVELGIVGLALFLAMLFFAILNLSRLRRAARRSGDAFMYSLATALGNGLMGFAVAAFFVSGMHARVFWFGIFLSTCLPAFLAKAADKAAASDSASIRSSTAPAENSSSSETHSEVSGKMQRSPALEVVREDRKTKGMADEVELRVDQLKFPER
jgi:O-antigen ligase